MRDIHISLTLLTIIAHSNKPVNTPKKCPSKGAFAPRKISNTDVGKEDCSNDSTDAEGGNDNTLLTDALNAVPVNMGNRSVEEAYEHRRTRENFAKEREIQIHLEIHQYFHQNQNWVADIADNNLERMRNFDANNLHRDK